jgi:Flp pilus assembly protein TadG
VKVDSHLRQVGRVLSKPGRLVTRASQGGQAMVEFALLATLFFVVILVGVQFAIIGQAVLAVNQASYLGARTASVNNTMTSDQLNTTLQSQISPTITGAQVSMALTNANDPACAGGTRNFGCPITVTVNYDATSKLFLPSNWTILGVHTGIVFPTALSSSESAMTE